MSVEVLVVVGLAIVGGLGWLVADVVGQAMAEGAQDAAFRRPSLAMRRGRHRGLMRTGYLCGVLAFGSLFMWLAVVTDGFEDDAADARMFLALGVVCGLGAVAFLTAWWRLADDHPVSSGAEPLRGTRRAPRPVGRSPPRCCTGRARRAGPCRRARARKGS